jgi:hypothetical protein
MKKPLFLLLSLLVFAGKNHSYGQAIITTIAGNGLYGNIGDGGPATAAEVEYVWFVARDNAGNIYVADNFAHRVRKINAAGIISAFAGNGTPGYSGDGAAAVSAELIGVAGIAADRYGNVYIADNNNHRVRKVNAAGTISTLAGNGVAGFSGDGGAATAAQLNSPYGLATDDSGNVYVADEFNYRIRKINSLGIISTIAGNGIGGYSGDGGPATAAQFTPTGIASDGIGGIYIATNNRIRKVSASGIITTVAGNGIAGFSGEGAPATTAKLNQPVGLAVDRLGNIFIADQYNHRIRKVTNSGVINTVAGNGVAGYLGDNGPATAAEFIQPLGICLDPQGNYYFSDYGNHRVRMVNVNNHIPAFTHWPVDSLTVCQNSLPSSINSLLAASDADAGQTETWTLIAGALHGTATVGYSMTSSGGVIAPAGATYVPAVGYAGDDTFKVRLDDGRSLDTITIYVRVRPLPDTGIITGSNIVCMGSPIALSNTATGGVWSVTNPRASVSGVGLVSGVSAGTDTIRHTFTTDGCSSYGSFVVTVYPVTDTISGPSAVCTGQSIALTGSPAGGAWNVTNTLAHMSGNIAIGDTAGVDTVIYTISNACGIFSTTMPITIIGFTIPTVIITATPATILAGEPDTLVAHVTNGGGISYGYQWQKNNTNIPGATDSVYISDTLSDGDSLICFVYNGPCNFSTFSWVYIQYHSNGIIEPAAEWALRLWPDPNKGTFNIAGSLVTESSEAAIEITDIIGRVVYRDVSVITNRSISKRISLGDSLEPGIYLLHIITTDGLKAIRFVVNK